MKQKIKIEEIILLHNMGIVGKIEARNWIQQTFKGFANARRSDIDTMIENYGVELDRENQLIGDLQIDGDE